MAERRMFAKSIVLSDVFLDMPMSARCLYFTLGMLADDDGFVGNPKSIMRQCGASQDDMLILLQKRYILGFESGVIVIKHWRMNNYLRNDRHQDTTYLEEKELLTIDNKGAYTEKDGNKALFDVGIPSDNQVTTVYGYTEDSIGKDSKGKDKDILSGNPDSESVKEIIDYLNSAIGTRYTTRSKSTNAKIKARLKEGHTIDDFKTVIDNKSAQWKDNAKMRTYLRPETLFAAEHFESYLNEGNINGSGVQEVSRTDEEQRNAEIDEQIRRINAGEITDESPFDMF